MFVLPRQKLRGKLVATMHQTHPDTPASLLGLNSAKCGWAHTAAGADTETPHRKSPAERGNLPQSPRKGIQTWIQHHLQPLVFLSHIHNLKAIKQINLITAKLGSFGSIKARLWVINENVAFV